MVYGIIGLINFAHGELVMVGALTALSVIQALMAAGLGLPPAVIMMAGLLVAMPFWGRGYFSFPSIVSVTTYNVGGATVTDQQILIVLLAAALMAGLLFIV